MGMTQSTVKTIIQCFLDEVISEFGKGNRLDFRDFGVFESRKREFNSKAAYRRSGLHITLIVPAPVGASLFKSGIILEIVL